MSPVVTTTVGFMQPIERKGGVDPTIPVQIHTILTAHNPGLSTFQRQAICAAITARWAMIPRAEIPSPFWNGTTWEVDMGNRTMATQPTDTPDTMRPELLTRLSLYGAVLDDDAKAQQEAIYQESQTLAATFGCADYASAPESTRSAIDHILKGRTK
jgi:hypothetical protein